MKRRIWAVITVFLLFLIFAGPVFADCGNPGDIVWSEVDYDQPSTDDSEFIEIFFPSGGTFSNCEIHFVNGATPSSPAEYRMLDIGALGTISAGTYHTWGIGGDEGIGTCTTDCIQNGPSDGFALVEVDEDEVVTSVVWVYSYEGTFSNYYGASSTDIGVSENNNSPNRSCNNGPNAGVGDSYNADPTPGGQGPNAITFSSFVATSSPISPWAIGLGGFGAVVVGLAVVVVRRWR